MRSLFPNADCFVTAPIQTIETLAFLQLPLPQVSPSPRPISSFSDLLFLRFGSYFDVSLRIEKLPIESALSKFRADVSPEDVEIRVEDFEDEDRSGPWKCFGFKGDEARLFQLYQEAKVLNEEEKPESRISHVSKTTEIELPQSNEGAVADKITQQYEVMQFETPELDVFVENASSLENEGVQIIYKSPEIKSLGILKPGLAAQCPDKVQPSFLLVEDVAFEEPIEQKENSEDDCSFLGQIPFNHLSFPTLEVDEIILESIPGFSTGEKLLSYFQNIELGHHQIDNLENEVAEVWSKKEYDTLQFISDHCLSEHSLESENGSLDNFPKVDLISLVEISQIKKNSVVQGTSGCDQFLPDQPIIFQEFHFLDVDSSQNIDVLFDRQLNKEPESCSWMFNEDMKFKDFNSLVVIHELILEDDTFKSLPVPVICDHEKMCSFFTIIEGKLANLKPHPSSALDGIYLDWHLLEEDQHSCSTFYYQNIVGDMVSHGIDFSWDSFDDRNVVYDFIFSDNSAHKFDMQENLEAKEFLSDVSISTSASLEVESSRKFPVMDRGESSAKNSEKASLLSNSMTQSNDLDFFLNAQKATTGINVESATRLADNKAMPPEVPLGVPVGAIFQGRESMTSLDMEHNADSLEELFDSFAVEEIHSTKPKVATDKVESHAIPSPFASMSFSKESKHPHGDLASPPETVIIVNTQNLDKEMIVSRRSTYQRILAIEKEGAQIVERDSDLPVDIIINSSICLVWYNYGNIRKKATALDEASSCLPTCIENIAANVLTLLSFNFSSCILVFEGEDGFLSTVMEFSDGLYAAAASLGIVVQIFCSCSSVSTDEIIMNSIIRYATRGVYPRMPESETLAESFLTKFPSVNPLTAHAILSSGGTLGDFLEWSKEVRTQEIQKYHIPNESISLLGDLCKYGEREDSRSIMTDCSSSVSSGTDSKRMNINMASKRKRWEFDDSLRKSGTYMGDGLHCDPANKYDNELVTALVEKPGDPFMSNDPKTFQEFRNPRQYDSNLLHEQDIDVGVRMNPSVVSKQQNFQISREPQTFKKIRQTEFSLNGELSDQLKVADETTLKNFDLFKTIRKPMFSFNDELSGQSQGEDETVLKNFNLPVGKGSNVLFENQKGDVINLNESQRSGKGFSSIDESISFLMPVMEKDGASMSKTARLSFDKNHQTSFPIIDEVFSERDIWTSVKDQRHTSGCTNCSNMDFCDDISSIKHPNKLLEESFKQRSTEKSRTLQFQETESPIRATKLSNALSFSTPEQKSPWTIDFLNRIRDKSRLRHQSIPCDASTNPFGFSGNISKDYKRRSPSIIEFFKNQGGSSKRVAPKTKKQKQTLQSVSSVKIGKSSAPASVQRTWTPQDKRARKTLSFTTNNDERQTKLVWSDGALKLNNKFMHHQI